MNKYAKYLRKIDGKPKYFRSTLAELNKLAPIKRFLLEDFLAEKYIMSELVKIRSIGQYGLNLDIDPTELPLNAISNGLNLRLKNGHIEPVVDKTTISTPTGFNAGHLMGVKTTDDLFVLVAGRSAVKVYDGAAWTDISSVAGYAALGVDDELLWSGCLLGNIPILNNFLHVPEYWSPQVTTQVLQPLQFDAGNTWAAKNYSAKVFRSHGQYLFALNLREGATYLPDSYRWSHPADVNGLPFTWDETDLSAVAGKASIGGNSGALVDGLTLREAFMMYSEFAIHALYPSGDEFVWHRTPVTYEYGLAAKDAIVELNFKHYFISKNDICINDGSVVQSIIYGKIKTYFRDTTNFEYISRSYAFHHAFANEIWFCIPHNDNAYASIAYVYNYIDDTWALRELPVDTPFIDYAIKLATPVTWATVPGTWATTPLKWSSKPFAESMPLGVLNADSSLISVDDPSSSTFLAITIERTGIKLTDDVQSQETVTKLFTNFTGTSTLNLRIGSQTFENEAVRWQNDESYDISVRRALEQNTTGAFHAYKITGTPTNTFKLNSLSFEYVESGAQ